MFYPYFMQYLINSQKLESTFHLIFKDRVILGTDYPFPLGEVHGFAGAYPGKVVDTQKDFDKKLKDKIMYKNALNFLNLDESKFT